VAKAVRPPNSNFFYFANGIYSATKKFVCDQETLFSGFDSLTKGAIDQIIMNSVLHDERS
jgi:hypothetical protein